MALNIFPRRTPPSSPPIEPAPPPLPEPAAALLETDDASEEARKRTRRGTRGGRGRGRKTDETTVDGAESSAAAVASEPETVATELDQKPAPRARRPRRTAAERDADALTAATPELPAEADAPAEPPPARRSRRGRGAALPEEPTDAQGERPVDPPPGRAERPQGRPSADGNAALLRAIEQQGRQLEHLARAQEDLARKLGAGGSNGTGAATRAARVGVFVDSANIELACDRLRARFDWAKVLAMLTKDRQLVRAIAYSPVHDDPGVSMETQRFAEPFLDKGFKLVTKPFKRFSDGTIKANVDIEMTLDVVNMLDRLDVVCLVSGDGDFQPLVEYVQRRGVRCEVVAVAASTAGQLRNAADLYIDLGQRLKEVRA